jgi:hypothetical protein
MNGQEVAALNGIAAAFGRNLTRNPHTGMTEAFNLFDVLPIALNFIPGIGTAASIALSAASGAASSAIEGGNPLEGALMGGITGAVGAGLGGSAADAAAGAAKEVGAEALAKIPDVTPEMAKAMGMPAEQAAKIAMDASAAQAAATPLGGTFTDIFGKGTDAQLQTALAAPFKAENLPLTYLGATALSSLPDMFGQDQGTGRPEYKYIPEQFPGSPRVVNPNYDPTMAAFGEQDAFSSGVDYARGYAYGGPVRGYKGGGRVEYPEAPEGYMWQGPTGGSGSRLRGQGGKMGQLVPDPNFRQQPRQRNIQPTNPNSLYAGGSPLIGDVPTTQVPLPGGQMGAPPPAMGMSSPAPNYSSFEIATSPTGEMPASGGGMGGQGYQGGAQQGGKNGGSRVGDGGGKRGNIMASMPGAVTAAPGQAAAQPEQPSTLPPMGAGVGMGMAYGGRVRGYANGGMVDQAMQLDDRTVVKEAMAALSGQSPNPEEAIAMFVDRFGESALQALMQKMQGGMQGGMQGRYMQGPGDGLSDSIPAVVDGQQPSALSTGEFVVPADAVSHLGNGDNKTGAKELYGMIDRLRQARTGNPTPPPAIDQRSVMPA